MGSPDERRADLTQEPVKAVHGPDALLAFEVGQPVPIVQLGLGRPAARVS
jgi:hypothetical protein